MDTYVIPYLESIWEMLKSIWVIFSHPMMIPLLAAMFLWIGFDLIEELNDASIDRDYLDGRRDW